MVEFLRRIFGSTQNRKFDTTDAAEIPNETKPAAAPATPAPPALDFLEQEYRFIAVDVETANSNKFSICQIGLAMVANDGAIRSFSCLIDPDDYFEHMNISIHGIDERLVAGHLQFDQFFPQISDFLGRHVLVQHSNFDRQAFDAACHLHSLDRLGSEWIDSVAIARRAWPELKSNGGHGLANLKKTLNLDFKHHDAGEDARAAAQVVLRAEEHTSKDFRQILAARAARPSYPKPITMVGSSSGALFGKSVCFTGELSMSRKQAAEIAAAAGLTVKASVSQKLDIVVVGDQDLTLLKGHDRSTKHRRADELIAEGHPIRIMGEGEFMALLKS